MKNFRLALIAVFAIFTFVLSAQAQVNPSSTYVKGYTKSNGTTVEGYYRTTPNNTNRDNYSTSPNINPYTNERGTVAPDNRSSSSYQSIYSTPTQPTTRSSYDSPAPTREIQTGPRGGQYYINSNGNKTYIKQ